MVCVATTGWEASVARKLGKDDLCIWSCDIVRWVRQANQQKVNSKSVVQHRLKSGCAAWHAEDLVAVEECNCEK